MSAEESREIIKGNIGYTEELLAKRIKEKYENPDYFVEDPDIRKMFYLFDELDILCIKFFLNKTYFEFSKGEPLPDDMKIVIDVIISPENRKALRKWYRGKDLNSAAEDVKEYLQWLTGEYF